MKNSRIKNVIEDIKKTRVGENRAWIYTEDGKIRDDVICIDTIEFLGRLKDYEISVSDKYISDFIEKPETEAFYTYNVNCNISNDICFWYNPKSPVFVLNVHLYGDARIVFDTFIAIKAECEIKDISVLYDFLENVNFLNPFTISIDTRYTVDLCIFSEFYSVFDTETMETIYDFCTIEREELYKEIERREQDGKID